LELLNVKKRAGNESVAGALDGPSVRCFSRPANIACVVARCCSRCRAATWSVLRCGFQRNKQGKKKVSNDEWASPTDPDARIAKMKDGRTHLAYKAEHVVDLDTEAIIDAEIYHANCADTATLLPSIEAAQQHLYNAYIYRDIKRVVAD
jgi:hypothetical protein